MPKENYKYKISIILTTYQSFSSVCVSASNLLLQNFPQNDYELIIISHGVKDGVSSSFSPLSFFKNLKTAFVPKREDMPYQPCYVRNTGIEQAEGKLVFLMHDNVNLIGNDYLHNLWKLSNKGERAVMTKKIVYRYKNDGTLYDGFPVVVHGFYAQMDAIPLKYLKIVGGFDTVYDGDNGYDDIDLWKRCEKEGCEFYQTEGDELLSIKHNLRDLYPARPTIANGLRNQRIACERGFISL